MTLLRGQLLTTGPIAIIAMCYAIAAPDRADPLERWNPDVAIVDSAGGLKGQCQSKWEDLKSRLPHDWNFLVCPPFVMAGDCSQRVLERYYVETVGPTSRALSIQFFDTEPAWPVVLVLCSSDHSYRECNRLLGERDRREYAGIYSRSEHRLIVNVSTGEGTLAHELTHALSHADFPTLPEWLDEGLASLFEECEFSRDGQRLIGLENWRGAAIRQAANSRTLRSISELINEQFAVADATLDYAQARYLCLYLQEKQLLEPFYRKCRSRSKNDRNGHEVLQSLFGGRDIKDIDDDFQAWLKR